jgi:hypothetical protein
MTTTKEIVYTFLTPADKVLVVHRRLFPGDRPRYFVAVVDAFNETNGLLRVTGWSLAETKTGANIVKKAEPRTKIVALTSGTIFVYVLPPETDVPSCRLRKDKEGRITLEDARARRLDLTEVPAG